MKLFKFFTTIGDIPDTYFLEEFFGFLDSISIQAVLYEGVFSVITFVDGVESYGVGSITLIEDCVFTDSYVVVYNEELSEIVTIADNAFQPLYIVGVVSFNIFESVSENYVLSITLEENIGYVESSNSFVYIQTGYRVTWRTRTHFLNYGYGASLYGDTISYGDGTADDLASFKVEVYKTETNTLLRTETITISDVSVPDDYAIYDYTYAYNLADNTVFEPNLTFRVYSIDITGRESPCRIVNLEPIDMG